MAEFLTIGEPLVVLASEDMDQSLDQVEHFTKFLAGAELNVAIGVARLEHSASYISKVGADSFGKFIENSLRAAEIELSNLTEDENHLTGFYLKEKVSVGDPAIEYFRKHSAASNLNATDIASVKFDRVKVAHLSGIFPALSETALNSFKLLNQRLNDLGVLTVFDPNLRLSLWRSQAEMIEVTNDLAGASQIILPGIDEAEILVGTREPERIADFYLQRSDLTNTVIVKLGVGGAYVKRKSGQAFTMPSFKIERVVDSVGAGDGFAVGLETALMEGENLESAVRRACAIGALAVQTPGDCDGYPTRKQLEAFLKNA